MYGVHIGAFCIDTGAHSGYTYRTIPTAVGLSICCRVEYFVFIMMQDKKLFFVSNTALNRLVCWGVGLYNCNTVTSYLPLIPETKQSQKLALFACNDKYKCILSPCNVIVIRDHEKNKTANGVLHDVVHMRHQGVLYFQSIVRFHSIAGLHPQSPRRCAWQPTQVLQNSRPSYPSHVIAAPA